MKYTNTIHKTGRTHQRASKASTAKFL